MYYAHNIFRIGWSSTQHCSVSRAVIKQCSRITVAGFKCLYPLGVAMRRDSAVNRSLISLDGSHYFRDRELLGSAFGALSAAAGFRVCSFG